MEFKKFYKKNHIDSKGQNSLLTTATELGDRNSRAFCPSESKDATPSLTNPKFEEKYFFNYSLPSARNVKSSAAHINLPILR